MTTSKSPSSLSSLQTPLSPQFQPARSSSPMAAGVALVFLLIALAWLYTPTLQQLALSWRDDEYYSHGPLLIPVSAFLIWQQRAALARAWNPGTGGPWSVALLVFGLLVAFFGLLVDINFIRAFSIPLVALGIVRHLGGSDFEKLLRFPILLFAAGVPISRVVVQTFSVPLQQMAAGGASLLLGIFGLQVNNDGVNIITPSYNFVVDVPCSGLKTATALFTIGLIVAYMAQGISLMQRITLALSSVFVALLTNILRIIFIILIGIHYGKEAAEGFLHSFSNVVTLTLSLILLLLFSQLLRYQAEEKRLEALEYEESDEEESEDSQYQHVEAATVSEPRVKANWLALSWKPLAGIGVCLLATRVLGQHAITPVETGPNRNAVANLQLPTRSGEFIGKSTKVEPAVFEMLRPDAAVQKRYRLLTDPVDEKGLPREWVDVIVIYSSDARGFHAPEICLRASGWTVNSKESRMANHDSKQLPVTLVTGSRKASRTYLAYFFADTQSQTSGWVSMLTKEALGRAMRRKTGSLEVQFGFSARELEAGGQLSPRLSRLILEVSENVRRQLRDAPANS